MVSGLKGLADRAWGAEPGLAGLLPRAALAPAGWAYGLAMGLRTLAHARGWKRIEPARLPVISVGNLTLGGTGKTPMTLYLAAHLARRGFRPAVVLRGYGGTVGTGPVLVEPGADPGEVGEEAILYTELTGVLVIAGSDRASGADLAARSGAGVVLLDDGFQHLGLARNLDLVLLDAARPLANGRVFPAGPLREPVSALRRAGGFVLTRAEGEEQAARSRAALESLAPGRPVFCARHLVSAVLDPRTGREIDIAGKKVLIAAGVARPKDVERALTALGPDQTRLLDLADHQVYAEPQVELINSRAREWGAELLAVTSKDLPKLGPFLDRLGLPVGVARLELELDRPGELTALAERAAQGRGRVPGVLKKARKGLEQRFPQGGRLLIRMPNWLGDAVMATPVLDNLRRSLPDWEISLLLKPEFRSLFQADPRVEGLIDYRPGDEHRGIKGRRALAESLRGRFQAGLLLPNSLDSAFPFWLAKIPCRVGYAKDGRSPFLTDPVPFTRPLRRGPQVDSYLGLLDYLGLDLDSRELKIHLPDRALAWASGWLSEAGLGSGPPLIGLAPGAAFGPAKAWPAQRYAQAARELSQKTGAGVLVFGSAAERPEAAGIAERIGRRARNLAGRTSLERAAALISRLDLMVANDSGLMHLAAGLGTPCVALFGPTDPLRCVHSTALGRALWRPERCSPCYRRECSEKVWCMENIGVGEVVAAGLELLAPDDRGQGAPEAGPDRSRE